MLSDSCSIPDTSRSKKSTIDFTIPYKPSPQLRFLSRVVYKGLVNNWEGTVWSKLAKHQHEGKKMKKKKKIRNSVEIKSDPLSLNSIFLFEFVVYLNYSSSFSLHWSPWSLLKRTPSRNTPNPLTPSHHTQSPLTPSHHTQSPLTPSQHTLNQRTHLQLMPRPPNT
jgi:hypothetical protein